MKDNFLANFAHAIAPQGATTRAVVNRETGEIKAFVDDRRPPTPGVVVVARANQQYVVGPIAYPAPGWIQIGRTAYPADDVLIRGPVLFIARPRAKAEAPSGH